MSQRCDKYKEIYMAITGKVLYTEFNEVFTEAEKLRSITLIENLSDDEIESFFNRMTNFCELCIKKTIR